MPPCSNAHYNFTFAPDRPELGGWPMTYKLAPLKTHFSHGT